MKLTAANVEEVIKDCLFCEGEDISNAVKVEGVIHNFGFHPERLEKHAGDIREMLEELPDGFKPGKGGGMSFLSACETKDGTQWGEHPDIERLFVLGLATKQAALCLPRAMWHVLPGGMPYFCVTPRETSVAVQFVTEQ
jgi:hypothetical protein